MLFASARPTLLPVIARSYLHRGPGAYGALLGFMGVGAVAAVPVLQRAQRVMKLDVLLAIATAGSGCVELAVGGIHQLAFLCGVMFVAGVFWLTVMSLMNTTAQSVLPAWVRARAMSVYLLVFFGSLSAGGVLWGVIATRAGAPMAMTVAACGMFATLLLVPRFRLIDHERLDLTPSLHWPAPVLVQAPTDDRGPVLVTVEYRVAPEHAEEFVKAMQRRRRPLMRTGAFRWDLYNDTEDPARFVETFLSKSWAEHERQHRRVSVADREIEDAIAAFHLGPGKPVVRHLIHVDLKSLQKSASQV